MVDKRAQQRDDKRVRILEAAIQAFSRDGYHQTRISDIAKAANVADGTVYLYFDGKKDLLSRIFEERMSRSLARGREEMGRIVGAAAKLRRIIELHLEDLGENPELATIFQIELRHSTRFMELVQPRSPARLLPADRRDPRGRSERRKHPRRPRHLVRDQVHLRRSRRGRHELGAEHQELPPARRARPRILDFIMNGVRKQT